MGTDMSEQSPKKVKNMGISPSRGAVTPLSGSTFKLMDAKDVGACKTNIQINHYGGAAAATDKRFTSTYRSSNS